MALQRTSILALAAALSLGGAATISNAEAATISLTPTAIDVVLGTQISLNVEMDFSTDATIGGGFDTKFDPTLVRFVSFTFDDTLGDDPDFRASPQGPVSDVVELGFGHFNGVSGPSAVGVMLFDTLAPGNAAFTMEDNQRPIGPFISAVTFDPQLVTFTPAEVTISAVPLPASVILLASGVIGLAAFRRR